MAVVLSLLATVISLALAIEVGRQYVARRKPYQLMWSVALFLFAVGTAMQFIAEAAGWSTVVYRFWYLSGAILTAAYLGQGTMHLLASRRVANVVLAVLILASVFAAVRVFTAPVDLSAAMVDGHISGDGFPMGVRLLTPFFNVYGTVLLVGGAALSVWQYFKRGGNANRAWGTGLIAIGAIVVAMGGTMSRFNIPQALYFTELLGVALIFGGFKLTARPVPSKAATVPAQP